MENFEFDKRINIEKMFTVEEFKQISDERNALCLKEAAMHHNYITKYQSENWAELLNRIALELPLKSAYREYSDIEKATVCAHVRFGNDETLINAILASKIRLRHFDQMNSLLVQIKKGEEIDIENIEIWQKNVLVIASRLKTYFGSTNIQLIFNRINHILAFKRDLFIQLQTSHDEKMIKNKQLEKLR